MANKRVIDLPDLSQEVQEGQYILVDSSGGTGKMDLKHVVDEAGSFDPEGIYPDLYAGNLTTDKSQTDRTPYLFRPTGGGLQRIGERCYPVLVGASVAENQLVQSGATSVTVQSGHKYYAKINGTESIGASTGSAITINDSAKDMVIDLTLMLPSGIADYAYTLEQATAGSGIAWLRSYGFISDEYKPYNTGTIESVEATAKVVRDENNENAVTYPLGSDVLRGIFKLDANNQLYADGDTKTSDGTITRKFKLINLGTLPFNDSEPNRHIFRSALNDAKMASDIQSEQFNPVNALMSNGYVCRGYGPITADDDKSFAIGFKPNGDKRLVIVAHDYDSISDFTQAMSGVYLVYELDPAFQTTEQSSPFTSPQIVYPDGTEEFVTETSVPIGHETEYPYDLKALVEGLIDVPDVPSTNGTYVLKATRSASGVAYNWVTG